MKLKRIRLFIAIATVIAACSAAAAIWADDLARKRSCENCGMDRKMYGYSRVLIRFADGSEVGTCSLNCAVIELDRVKTRQSQEFLVADRDSRTLIDAATACWVMGGDKSAVMARRPKWAFVDNAAAERFVGKHGGAVTSWDAILRAAREDAYRPKE